MKEKAWVIVFVLFIAIIGHIMVSSANKHVERDNKALYEWRMNWADRR